MCGIAGFVDLGGLDGKVESRARSTRDHLRRRGPDGEAIWSDAHCALVHTRLAVIDLSPGGAQPMQRDGLVITFNGEIFNYAEIRTELSRLGHTFRSNSDTEVILAGWRQWGEALLPRIVGMFAFAIWDASTRTLFAARDRFGEKPFLYAMAGDRFAFGSDLQSCETMLGEMRPIDPAVLRAFFTLRFIPEPWSIATGIRKLPAGHWLRFDQSGVKLDRWYDLPSQRPATPADHASAASPAL
jgi:asparagine synthase (glutamine-hydrolysing)